MTVPKISGIDRCDEGAAHRVCVLLLLSQFQHPLIPKRLSFQLDFNLCIQLLQTLSTWLDPLIALQIPLLPEFLEMIYFPIHHIRILAAMAPALGPIVLDHKREEFMAILAVIALLLNDAAKD